MKGQPTISVLILESQREISGLLRGNFFIEGLGLISGQFSAKIESDRIIFSVEGKSKRCKDFSLRLKSSDRSSFTLYQVIIGSCFHWEREKNLTYEGDLVLKIKNGLIQAINEIPLEDYLKSVISSEVNPSSPLEFLKAHAIISRSWILSKIEKKAKTMPSNLSRQKLGENEIIRWYDSENHDTFDVCSNDHCQRYYGLLESGQKKAAEAVNQTYGLVITYQGEICNACYSKICGGITEDFDTAWYDIKIPYLKSNSDSYYPYLPITNENEARKWILSSPEVYCNIKDENLLKNILGEIDLETKTPFRWRIEYSKKELEEILRQKSDIDFGSLYEIIPLLRGPSGRIHRLKIIGSKKEIIVGKELEIRRWLSRSHLFSSAFIIEKDQDKFIFHGAGWGHGVGLCQIGAAHMAIQGFSMEAILKHYYSGIDIKKIY